MTMLEPTKWYSIKELMELGKEGVIPLSSRRGLMTMIKEGKLKAYIKGEGKAKAYMFLGSDIADHIKKSKTEI